MDEVIKLGFTTLALGIGATAVMDAASVTLKTVLGIPVPNYALVGRWVGHMAKGRFAHASIAASTPVRGEHALGWSVHYATGVVFAAGLLALVGTAWLERPTLALALAFGAGTVTAPFLLMQPAMGAGLASRRTPRPGQARLRSLGNHAFFGIGLYVTAQGLSLFMSP